MRERRGRVVWLLLGIAVALLLVAAASGSLYVLLRQRGRGSGDWQDPIAATKPDEIVPELALYPLAGASELETVDAAMANGDLETAYATLVFGPDLSDAKRIGRLILLGGQFVEVGRSDRAALSYQQVYDTAILSPELNDPTRADALLASGRGWAQLGQKAQALESYDQVYLIALRSPYLQMAQRRGLLSALEMAYRDAGDNAQAQVCRQGITELDQESRPQPPARPVASPNLPIGMEHVSSPEVGALEESRRQAAYALLQAVPEGGAPSPDLVGRLTQALQAEDQAKLSLYQQELEATTQLGRRVDLHWQMIVWLTLKYRVATRGFGLSLVPDWEGQVAEIQSALSRAYEDLAFDYQDLVAGLPEASLVGPGTYEGRRAVVLAGRLGQYPNSPAQQLTEKLRDVVTTLIAAGYVDPLYVDATVGDEGISYFLSTAEQYGLRDEAPSQEAP